MEEIDLLYARLYYGKPVVYVEVKENSELGFLEIRELTFYAEKLSGHKPYFTFSDITAANIKVTPQGRKVAADIKESPLNKGTAVFVKSEMTQLAATFFSSINSISFPFRVFTDRQEGINWLLQLPLN